MQAKALNLFTEATSQARAEFRFNQAIIPELAIIGMKSQVTPYGQMAPEDVQRKEQFDASQRQDSNQKVVDAARATYNQYAGKSNLKPEEQEALKNAEAVLTPIGSTGKFQILVDPQGQEHNVPMGTEIPSGWKVYEKPTASSVTQPGTERDFTANALKGYGVDDKTPPATKAALEKYLHDWWQWRAAQTTSTSGEHMETDPTTGKLVAVKTYGSSTRGAGAPKPPAGFSPVGEDGLPQKGGEEKPSASKGGGRMSKPPAAPGAGRGKMTAPPLPPGVRDTGINSMAAKKWNVSTAEGTRKAYEEIENKYHAELSNNAKNAATPADRAALDSESLGKREAAKASLVLSRAAQIESIGGDPWKKNTQGVQFIKFPGDDGTYGTMDGVNWVDIHTGYSPSGGK